MDVTDLHDRLDEALGSPPSAAGPGTAMLVSSGRAALRRRRLAYAGGAAALVLAAGVAVPAVVGGPDPATDHAASPAATDAGPVRGSLDVPVDHRPTCGDGSGPDCGPDSPVYFDADGDLVRSDGGVAVTGRWDDVPRGAYDASAAVEVVHDGETSWAVLRWEPGEQTQSWFPADPDGSFDAWVDLVVDDPGRLTSPEFGEDPFPARSDGSRP